MTQPDDAAAAAREAAPDDTGLEGSRGSLGVTVTWAELRFALLLSVVCAVSVALLSVPVGAADFLVHDRSWATFGKGVSRKEGFRDAARMQRREPLIVGFDWNRRPDRRTSLQLLGNKRFCCSSFRSATSPTLARL